MLKVDFSSLLEYGHVDMAWAPMSSTLQLVYQLGEGGLPLGLTGLPQDSTTETRWKAAADVEAVPNTLVEKLQWMQSWGLAAGSSGKSRKRSMQLRRPRMNAAAAAWEIAVPRVAGI